MSDAEEMLSAYADEYAEAYKDRSECAPGSELHDMYGRRMTAALAKIRHAVRPPHPSLAEGERAFEAWDETREPLIDEMKASVGTVNWLRDFGRIQRRQAFLAGRASRPSPPPAFETLASSLGYPWLPCPICRGTEGCDHSVPERARAHLALHRARG